VNTQKDQARRFRDAVEDYSVDLCSALMDSFAARVREEARHPDNSRATQGALLAVARSAEATAQGVREDLARRRKIPADISRIVMELKETETDG